MENFLGILFVILFLIGVMFLFSIYTKFLAKISTKGIQKRLDSGKIDDKKLMKLYKEYKKQKDNKILAIFLAGIFYKSYLKIPEKAYEAYEQEMIKRNLLDKV